MSSAMMEQPLEPTLFEQQRLGPTYRLMAQVAMQQLHEAWVREKAMARQIAALRDEIRRYVAMQVKP